MQRIFLKAKIHRVTVTGANPDYEGSISVDTLLMEAASMSPYEQVHVYNVSNGCRFTTYLMEGGRGSGEITVNGAAAHLVQIGHLLIIAAYGLLEPREIAGWKPAVILVDTANRRVIR